MDIFSEQLVSHRKSAKETALTAGIILAAILLSFLLALILGVLSFVFICGVWFGAWWLITRTDTEYEYILTSSVLDIDKIMAKRSRKRILSLDLKEAESFMPIEDLADKAAKIIDVTPNGIEDGVYGIDFNANGQNSRLIFKPNSKMLSAAKKAVPSLVVVKSGDVEEQF